jgi:hypothetical protein
MSVNVNYVAGVGTSLHDFVSVTLKLQQLTDGSYGVHFLPRSSYLCVVQLCVTYLQHILLPRNKKLRSSVHRVRRKFSMHNFNFRI